MSTHKQPNVVIFNPDQWRGDVMGCHGDPAAVTPNLDELVQTEAVSFRYSFCQNPVCTPSRCSFMSGWYPHVRGHRSMGRMLRPPHDNNLLSTLKDAGYYVWWGGKNDLVPAQDGFDRYCHVKYNNYDKVHDPTVQQPKRLYGPERARDSFESDEEFKSFYLGTVEPAGAENYYRDSDWAAVEGAIDFIRNYKGEAPFFVYLAIAYPHPPYIVEERFRELIDPAKLPPRKGGADAWTGPKPRFARDYHERLGLSGWSEEKWTELRRVYYAMVARVDHQIGLVLDALREAGSYDDTAFFMFSDHGEWAGDYNLVEKHQIMYDDSLTRVPFVVKPPKNVPRAPGVRDQFVELIDLPATVEAWTGVRLPQTHFGRDLSGPIADPKTEHRDAVFSEGGRLESEPHLLTAESGGKPPNPNTPYYTKQTIQAEALENLGRSFMVRTKTHKYVRRLYEADELYDLEADPEELHNLIEDNPETENVRRELRDRMFVWLSETTDTTPVGIDRRE